MTYTFLVTSSLCMNLTE